MGFYILVTPVSDSKEERDKIAQYLTSKLVRYAMTCYYYQNNVNEYEIFKSNHDGLYLYVWPNIIHDNEFFTNHHCPTPAQTLENNFTMKYGFNLEGSKALINYNPTPIISCFKLKLKNHIEQCLQDPKMYMYIDSEPYMYSVFITTYYFYVMSKNIVIDEEHTYQIFETLATISHNTGITPQVAAYIASFHDEKVTTIFTESTGWAVDYLSIETILKSYESNDAAFNFFKGVFLAIRIANNLSSTSVSYNSMVLAHVLRENHFTYMDGRITVFMNYRNKWTNVHNPLMIIQAMQSIRTLIYHYIDDDVLNIAGVDPDSYDKGLLNLSKSATKSTCQTEVFKQLDYFRYSFDSKRYNKTLRFKDVVYDLRQRKARKPFPFDIHQNVIDYNFYSTEDYAIEAELDSLMETYFEDPELRTYIYHIFGRALRGDVSDKSIWFFLGESNTGKSAFMELVKYSFGMMADVLSNQFLNKKTTSGDATTTINKIVGKLLGIIQEPSNGVIDVPTIKERTGDSEINTRELFKEAKTSENTSRYVVCANNLSLNTYDVAFWMRVHVVKFTRTFVNQEMYNMYKESGLSERYRLIDPDFKSKIPRLAPALMKRFINAYHDTEGKHMIHPGIVDRYTREFRIEHDVTAKFFSEFFEKTEHGGIDIEFFHVYDYYVMWYHHFQGDKRLTLSDSNLIEAARSNGYIVTENKVLLNVIFKPLAVHRGQLLWFNDVSVPSMQIHNISLEDYGSFMP